MDRSKVKTTRWYREEEKATKFATFFEYLQDSLQLKKHHNFKENIAKFTINTNVSSQSFLIFLKICVIRTRSISVIDLRK